MYRITGKICLGLSIMACVSLGCKKKEIAPSPPVAVVQPLPKKAVQANSSTARQATVQQKGAVQATPPAVAAQLVKGAAPLPATGTTPAAAVQKQVSSSRLMQTTAVNLDFSNRRDPFKPYIQVTPTQSANAGRQQKDALPIQRFDIDKFRISGIITGLKENSALILDPAGKGYVVKAGMQIGNNDGRIKRITDSSLEVEETFRDDNGKTKKRLVKLMLIRKK